MDKLFNFFNKRTSTLKGSYLAVVVDTNSLLKTLSKKLREEGGFLPMEMAIPPRERDVFHSTIAFFMSGLTDDDIEKLRNAFSGREIELTVTGHGKAVKEANQAMYFSLEPKPIDSLRDELVDMGLSFNKTDPHITFGVHVETRKDAHGVPKQKQIDLEPFSVTGKVHLKVGLNTIF